MRNIQRAHLARTLSCSKGDQSHLIGIPDAIHSTSLFDIAGSIAYIIGIGFCIIRAGRGVRIEDGRQVMEAVIQSFIAGFPILMLHSSVTIAMLGVGVLIYIKITPYDDIGLIRDGNTAAAISLGGAVLGFALPLAFTMASSITVWEVLIWGPVTLVLQLIAYRLTDAILRDLPKRIVDGEIAPAVFLVSIKLAVAAINAAAVTG
ncbi:MAG: putative membrane protein [Alphaproteobacteria bacterium]